MRIAVVTLTIILVGACTSHQTPPPNQQNHKTLFDADLGAPANQKIINKLPELIRLQELAYRGAVEFCIAEAPEISKIYHLYLSHYTEGTKQGLHEVSIKPNANEGFINNEKIQQMANTQKQHGADLLKRMQAAPQQRCNTLLRFFKVLATSSKEVAKEYILKWYDNYLKSVAQQTR